jgi:Holliday junction DNA helicase RuvA
MIAHLRGVLLAKSPNQAIVECAGVGYDVAISVATFSALPDEGAETRLHIYTRVAEDQLALYGFAEPAEKRLFEKLLTITGIGPKLAITVLSGIDAQRLVSAIRAADHAQLVKIPGIGKKTAERVVLELKDKLDDLATAPAQTANSHVQPGHAEDDALSALVNLGYARPVAQKAIETALERNPAAKDNFETLFRAAMASIR